VVVCIIRRTCLQRLTAMFEMKFNLAAVVNLPSIDRNTENTAVCFGYVPLCLFLGFLELLKETVVTSIWIQPCICLFVDRKIWD